MGATSLPASVYEHVSMWELTTGREVRRFDQPTHMSSMALSHDGRYLLTGSNDQTVRLWDVASGQQLRLFLGHSNCICSVAFSPDGKYVLTGGDDQTARLWDTQTGQELRIFISHTGGVNVVAFSPDGKQVLTGSADGTARLWDAATGEQLRIVQSQNERGIRRGVLARRQASADRQRRQISRGYGAEWPGSDSLVCASLPRDFTPEERAQYGITDDEPTCPKM